MNVRKKMVAALACLAVALFLVPAAAGAEEAQKGTYVALGDSITTGYGLADGEKSFVDYFAEGEGLEATVAAAEGATSADLLASLSDTELLAVVAQADVITVSIGGNDILGALYAYLANAYNATSPEAPVTAEGVQAVLAGDDLAAKEAMLEVAAGALDGFATSAEASQALSDFSENLVAIVLAIRGANPDATLVVLNQYNPYGKLPAIAQGTEYAEMAQAVSDAFDAGAAAINQVIDACTIVPGYVGAYVVADACSAIADSASPATNASVSVVNFDPLVVDVNLDFHPNQVGHALIATAVTNAVYPALQFTDVSRDDWSFEPVNWAVLNGLLTGYGDGRLGHNETLTRGQFAEILYRQFAALVGTPADSSVLDSFTDLDTGWYSEESMTWAVGNGLLKGDGDRLMPGVNVSREMMVTVMMSLVELAGGDVSATADLSDYPDSDELSWWSEKPMSWAVASGLISGTQTADGTLVLGGTRDTTRAEFVTVLMRWTAAA